MSIWHDPGFLAQHAALTDGAGIADLGQRTQVELVGEDRAAFLHNFCTNDIRGLKTGGGCEAFITSVQGKILAHVFVFCRADALVLDTVAGQGPAIVAHLDRYLIREKVEFRDVSSERTELLLAGTNAEGMLAAVDAAPPSQRLAHMDAEIFGRNVSVRRVDMTGNSGFFISCAWDAGQGVITGFVAARAMPCEPATVEATRIEAGFPLFGPDISEKNLPQEVGRDQQAISFTKGCYLGQETVARIDALGHVNQTLVGVRFSGSDVPTPGVELTADGKTVGHVTSAAFSPRLGCPLALAYVRRGHNAPDTRLASPAGDAAIVALPV